MSDFANIRPMIFEGSQQFLFVHSDTTMEVDVEVLLLRETPHNTPLRVLAISEMAILSPQEEEVFQMPPSITAGLLF